MSGLGTILNKPVIPAVTAAGYINAPCVQKVTTVVLAGPTYVSTRFYPVVIDSANPSQAGLYRHTFAIDMPSQGGGVAFNDHWIQGWVQAGGWSDQQPRSFQFSHGYFDSNERSILGVFVGATIAVSMVVVYLRGGSTYYVTTASGSVTPYSTAYSIIDGVYNNTFAVKDAAGGDAVGTSTGITQLFFGLTSVPGTYTSGVNVVQNVNSAYNANPATSGSFGSDLGVLDRINGGDIVLDTGMTPSGPVWIQARRHSNFADSFALLLNPNGGNVAVGTNNPSAKLHVIGDIALPYGNVIRVSPENSAAWPSGTTKLLETGWNGSNDTVKIYCPGSQSATSKITIIATGNVGIGNDTPTYRLDVAGDVRGTSLIVGGSGSWTAGSIYSDTNWGILMRMKQASPVTAQFAMYESTGNTQLMNIDTSYNANFTGKLNAANFNTTAFGAQSLIDAGYAPTTNGTNIVQWQIPITGNMTTIAGSHILISGYLGGYTTAAGVKQWLVSLYDTNTASWVGVPGTPLTYIGLVNTQLQMPFSTVFPSYSGHTYSTIRVQFSGSADGNSSCGISAVKIAL